MSAEVQKIVEMFEDNSKARSVIVLFGGGVSDQESARMIAELVSEGFTVDAQRDRHGFVDSRSFVAIAKDSPLGPRNRWGELR